MERTAIVTGGASGIGRAICEQLASDGHRVAVLDRDADGAAAVAERLPTGSLAVGVDVADADAIDGAFENVRAELGPVGILVTSAALADFASFGDITLEHWQRTIAVNLTGTFLCMQAALTDMAEAGWGRIVTISSVAGVSGSARQGHYSASKGGVIALTKAVALEYAGRGVTANTVPPFAVETPALVAARAAGDLPDERIVNSMIPAGRLGQPADVAAVCSFLCSEGAGYVTGQVVSANGGAST